MDGMLFGHCHQPYQSTQQKYFNINWFELTCQKSNHTCLFFSVWLDFGYFMVSNVVTLESVQSIVTVLSLHNISFSPENFVEISVALPLVCFCFFCNFVFVAVSCCVVFIRGCDHKIGQFCFGQNDFFMHEWC
jgi:hypothetical protein